MARPPKGGKRPTKGTSAGATAGGAARDIGCPVFSQPEPTEGPAIFRVRRAVGGRDG